MRIVVALMMLLVTCCFRATGQHDCDTTFALQRAEIVYQQLQDFVETVFTPITIEKGYKNRNYDEVLITVSDYGIIKTNVVLGYNGLPDINGYEHIYSIPVNGVDIIVAHNCWDSMFKPKAKYTTFYKEKDLCTMLLITEDDYEWTLKINGERLEFVDFSCFDIPWFNAIPRYRIMPLVDRMLRIPIGPPASILDSCRNITFSIGEKATPPDSGSDNLNTDIEAVDWDSLIAQLQESYVPDTLEEGLQYNEDKMAYRALGRWCNLIEANETAKAEDYGWLLMSCRTYDAAVSYGLTEAVTEYFILHPEELEILYRIFSSLDEERREDLLHFIPTMFGTLESCQPQLSYISDREQILQQMESIYPSFFAFFARLGINIEVRDNQILINGEVFNLD